MCSKRSEFKLASTVKDNKKGFLKYFNSKRKIRDSISPLLDEVSHLTNRDIDNTEMFNTFFASVFNTDDGPWDLRSPVLEEHDWGMIIFQLTLNLFETCCSGWRCISLWGLT